MRGVSKSFSFHERWLLHRSTWWRSSRKLDQFSRYFLSFFFFIKIFDVIKRSKLPCVATFNCPISGRAAHQSEQAVAESSNDDNESDGQGAFVAANRFRLATIWATSVSSCNPSKINWKSVKVFAHFEARLEPIGNPKLTVHWFIKGIFPLDYYSKWNSVLMRMFISIENPWRPVRATSISFISVTLLWRSNSSRVTTVARNVLEESHTPTKWMTLIGKIQSALVHCTCDNPLP